MADTRAPEHEAERRGVRGVLQVHLFGLHFAVIHDPHLQQTERTKREEIELNNSSSIQSELGLKDCK